MKKKVLLFLSLAILGQPWNARGSTAPNAGPNLSISKRVNAPTVSVVSPAANAVFSEGQPVTITASVSDPEAAISKVEFYSGTTKIGEDLFSPYSITWTDIPAGSYVITAKAYSESGAEATSEEVVFTVGDRVNQAPVVSIVTPSSNAAIAEGETVVISVNASDADGSVAKVELFSGSVKIAERTSLPYTFNWSDLAAGTYTITVRATDKEGAVASSSVTFSVYAVTPGVPPVVEITSPSNNASFEEGRVITINADASDADGTIEKVEYYNGTTLIGQELYEPYSLLWNNAPVGTHTITVKAIDNSGLFTVSAPITVVVTERSALKAPFHGTPAEIPGRIEAEDFDLGGLHIAYYDDTPDNKGGHYRDEYVDIEKCAEGGYDIGYMDIGEWLDYTVEVKETGTYELGVRVGSPNTGKVLHVEMNGLDISGPVTVPNTGDWQKYVTVKVPNIELTAGVQTMRIVMDSAEFNLNYVEFKKISAPTTESTPFHGTPAIIPGRIEAEDYDLGGLDIAYYDDTPDNKGGQYRDDYVDIENCAEGGYDIGYMDIGEWLNYTVEVEETGTYELGVRVGSPNTGKVLHIEMNGVDISGPVTVPNTGDWQKYVTVKVPNIELTAGVQIMRIVMDSAEFNLNWVEFKKVSAPTTESTPFHGTPAIIPGRIEAEDYDLGGLDIAYYDDTPDNKGGHYRDDYVDIEKCAEGGYDIGYMDIGEWLNYTVEVEETGTYELGVRVGSPNTGKILHIEMNGVDISGPVEVPNTGDWQKYVTVKVPNIELTAGVQIMRIVMDSAEFNLNWVEFKKVSAPTTESTPFHGTPAIIPGRIEAEDYDLGGLDIAYYDDTPDNKGGQYRDDYVDIENCAEGGYDIGFMDIGEWLNYTVEVEETGTYELGVRVGSPNTGKILHIEMNGVDISGPVEVPNTGDWQKYVTVKVPNIELTAGVQIMRIVMDSAEFNLNWVEFKKVSTPPVTESTPFHGTPAIIPGRIEAEDYDLGGLNVAYYDDTPDNKGGQYRDDYVDIENCAEGGYDIGFMDIGEWLNYTVEVEETGTYELGVRVGSPNTGKVLHIEMNGVDISGPVEVPNTGDWQKYVTVKVPNIELTAGVQIMRIVMDSAEFNLNWVEFKKVSTPPVTESTPFHGTPAIIPGRIEAEDYDLGGLNVAYYDDTPDNKGGQYRDDYVDIERSLEGGYNIGYMDIGEWLNYTVEVKETGLYELGVRAGSPYTGKVMHIEMNGVDISGPIEVPNTGAWQKYETVRIPNIPLSAGVQVMKIVLDSAEFLLNWVEFIPVKTPSDSTDTCLLTVAPESSKFVIRNGFGDQYSGAGLSNVDGALQIVQRQWGQSHLYVIESASKYSVEAGKAYTISFDFKDDELNNVVSIETGFGKSIEWNGTIDAQPLAVIEGPFSSVDFEKQSVTFNALSTGNYYLVVKLNWRGQPNARVTTFIKNISVCEEIAMPSAQMAANGEMSIAGPNPFNDETLIYIPFAGNGNAEAYVNITDVYGKPVTTYSTPFEGQLLPIGKGLAVGIYIVTVSYEGQVYTTRVIKN